MNLKLIMTIVLAVLVAIFIAQNMTVVQLRFLFWSLSMSRALLFILLVFIGIAVGWLLHGHLLSGKRQDRE